MHKGENGYGWLAGELEVTFPLALTQNNNGVLIFTSEFTDCEDAGTGAFRSQGKNKCG